MDGQTHKNMRLPGVPFAKTGRHDVADSRPATYACSPHGRNWYNGKQMQGWLPLDKNSTPLLYDVFQDSPLQRFHDWCKLPIFVIFHWQISKTGSHYTLNGPSPCEIWVRMPNKKHPEFLPKNVVLVPSERCTGTVFQTSPSRRTSGMVFCTLHVQLNHNGRQVTTLRTKTSIKGGSRSGF